VYGIRRVYGYPTLTRLCRYSCDGLGRAQYETLVVTIDLITFIYTGHDVMMIPSSNMQTGLWKKKKRRLRGLRFTCSIENLIRWRGIIIIMRRCEQCAILQPAMLSVSCSMMGIAYEIVYRIFYLNHCSDRVSACRRRKSISCLNLYRSRRNQYYIISVMYILYEQQTITI